MNIIKKYTLVFITAGIITFSGASLAAAESQTNNAAQLAQRLTLITQLMDIMDRYPEFKPLIEPYVNEALASMFSSLEDTKVEKKEYKAAIKDEKVTAKKVSKKPKKYDANPTQLGDIEEIEASPYENVEGKWVIDIETSNKEYRIYVYDVENDDDLVEKVADKINTQFNAEISVTEVESIIDIES